MVMRRLALESRSPLAQVAAGVALVSVIPLLVTVYLLTTGREMMAHSVFVGMMLIWVALVTLGGFLLLFRQPAAIARMRKRLGEVSGSDLGDVPLFLNEKDDVGTVEEGLSVILASMKERVRRAKDEEARLQAQVFQARKSESLEVMAFGLAHDLNNMITCILGHASLVKRMTARESPAQESLKEISTTALKIVELSNQMMLFAARGPRDVRPLDLGELLERIRGDLEGKRSANSTLDVERLGGAANVAVDERQIVKAIQNVVENAFESLGERGGAVRIGTGSKFFDSDYLSECHLAGGAVPGCYVYVRVSDNGRGMSETELGKIFDPFFTSKMRGHGLGLSELWGVVRGHGGIVRVASRVGEGTVVEVLLPPQSVEKS